MSDQLDRIEAGLAELKEMLGAMAQRRNGAAPASRFDVPAGAVAPASELDSKYGDPVIKKDPPRWSGPSFVGQPYSACSAEYLEEMAGFLEWKAGKNEEDPERAKFAAYDRKDAARALGWAQRVRDAAATAPADLFGGSEAGDIDFGGDDSLPF